MGKIRTVVIGAGRMGQIHINNIVNHIPQLELKCIVDPTVESSWVQALPGSPLLLSNCDSLYEKVDFDALVICAPTNQHLELAIHGVQKGKHIFCEKPVAFQIKDLEVLEKAVDEKEVHFVVGFNRRFDKQFVEAKTLLDQGKVQSPILIKLINRDPKCPSQKFANNSGGLFLDFSIHDIDMLHYLTGQKVKEVYAQGQALIDPSLEEIDDIDTALITLKLEKGTLCNIDNCRETGFGYDQRLEIIGRQNSLFLNNVNQHNVVLYEEDGSLSSNPMYSFAQRYKESYIDELIHFARLINDEVSPSQLKKGANIDDAKAALKIALAAKQSYLEKRPILL